MRAARQRVLLIITGTDPSFSILNLGQKAPKETDKVENVEDGEEDKESADVQEEAEKEEEGVGS